MDNKTEVNTDIAVEVQNIVDLEGIEKVLEAVGGQQAEAFKAIATVEAAGIVQDQRNFENVRDLAILAAVAFLIVKAV